MKIATFAKTYVIVVVAGGSSLPEASRRCTSNLGIGSTDYDHKLKRGGAVTSPLLLLGIGWVLVAIR